MMVERVSKHGKERLNLDNLRWKGVVNARMHVALCYSVIFAAAITAHKIGRPELAYSIKAFQYRKRIIHTLCVREATYILLEPTFLATLLIGFHACF
ncbi:MAG: hypothetical protein DRP15_02540 [Candidatus Aenigmatarchaeota archaeon]|nr:MAG: hypothetical protein DRP15_02540 [Candidatus Aenigmarchaeota archaeon]